MATAKQLAALAKARAARKKIVAKKVKAKSSKRRRNPAKKKRFTINKAYCMTIKKGKKTLGFWDDERRVWDTDENAASCYSTLAALKKELPYAVKKTPAGYAIHYEVKKR